VELLVQMRARVAALEADKQQSLTAARVKDFFCKDFLL